jgi:excisionase family DNA binding protein
MAATTQARRAAQLIQGTMSAEEARQELLSEGLCGIEEARRYLAVSRTTLYEIMNSGDLAYVKFGRNRRVPRRALRAFAEKQLVGA